MGWAYRWIQWINHWALRSRYPKPLGRTSGRCRQGEPLLPKVPTTIGFDYPSGSSVKFLTFSSFSFFFLVKWLFFNGKQTNISDTFYCAWIISRCLPGRFFSGRGGMFQKWHSGTCGLLCRINLNFGNFFKEF